MIDTFLAVGMLAVLAGGTMHAATQPSATDLRPLALTVARPVPLSQRARERVGAALWLVWATVRGALTGAGNRWA